MEKITNPVEYLDQLGGMHDALVLNLSIDCVSSSLSIVVDDINANFEGLDDYLGEAKAELAFTGVSGVSIANGNFEKPWIFECVAKDEGGVCSIICHLSPSGLLEFKFTTLFLNRLNGQA